MSSYESPVGLDSVENVMQHVSFKSQNLVVLQASAEWSGGNERDRVRGQVKAQSDAQLVRQSGQGRHR